MVCIHVCGVVSLVSSCIEYSVGLFVRSQKGMI